MLIKEKCDPPIVSSCCVSKLFEYLNELYFELQVIGIKFHFTVQDCWPASHTLKPIALTCSKEQVAVILRLQ